PPHLYPLSLHDALPIFHRVHAGGNRLGAFTDDRSRENRRGGGAVAGRISGLRSDFAHHLQDIAVLTGGQAISEDLGIKLENVTRSEEHTSELQSRGHLV